MEETRQTPFKTIACRCVNVAFISSSTTYTLASCALAEGAFCAVGLLIPFFADLLDTLIMFLGVFLQSFVLDFIPSTISRYKASSAYLVQCAAYK